MVVVTLEVIFLLLQVLFSIVVTACGYVVLYVQYLNALICNKLFKSIEMSLFILLLFKVQFKPNILELL